MHTQRYSTVLIALLLVPLAVGGGAPVASAQQPGDPGLEELVSNVFPGIVTDTMLLDTAKDPNNWILYGRDYSHTRYSPLSEINTQTVRRLAPKWIVSFGQLDSQGSQAMAFNGNVYVTSSYNHAFRVDGGTGRVVWRYDHPLPGDLAPHLCCDVVNRGVALYKDKLYMATLDAHVVALDASSGRVVWDKKVGDYTYAESLTVLPLAVKGKIIVGTSGAEFGVRGWITALNAETGEEVWKTYTVPGPGEPGNETWPGESWKYGGGSAWITGSYDPELNTVFWGVGNPGPWDRHVRLGDNLYTNSTLALDPDTGKIKYWFQYTPNDPYDYDGVNEAVLANVEGRKVWLHADRNGYFYAIDRTNGKFIYAVPLGKINWNKGFTREGRPIFNWPEMDVVYDRVTEGIYPALFGGKEWNPMAYNPHTMTVYVPAYSDMSTDYQAKKQEWRRGELFLGLKVMRWTGGGGSLRALDARNGELKWAHSNPMPFRSGILVTGGNLVFAGDVDGHLMAFDATTGQMLWKFNCGSGIYGGATTYTVDGRQYVSIVVGSSGANAENTNKEWLKTHQKGGMLITFGLVD
ncbi:MAG: PQQ-dependent dehydrogenase, methanol/ethanol family [candidate division NC10 bacterium]|nr:PQQ-dependent dehydrogenase, methanol/ethanol family [candidate division NC10 bacterium]